MNEVSLLLGVLSVLASVGGLLFGAIQARKTHNIKREESFDNWQTIRELGLLMHNLEKSGSLRDNVHISGAYNTTITLFRSNIKRAALREKQFSAQTIEKWRRVGKLKNEWQETQARFFLETESVEDSITKESEQ